MVGSVRVSFIEHNLKLKTKSWIQKRNLQLESETTETSVTHNEGKRVWEICHPQDISKAKVKGGEDTFYLTSLCE